MVDGREDAAEEAGEDGEAVAEVEGDEVFDGLGVEGGRGGGDDEGGVAGEVRWGALESGNGLRGWVEDGVDVFGQVRGRENFWRQEVLERRSWETTRGAHEPGGGAASWPAIDGEPETSLSRRMRARSNRRYSTKATSVRMEMVTSFRRVIIVPAVARRGGRASCPWSSFGALGEVVRTKLKVWHEETLTPSFRQFTIRITAPSDRPCNQLGRAAWRLRPRINRFLDPPEGLASVHCF